MSRARAINAFCKQCIYDPVGGTGNWRQQVEACTVTRCPLYAYRPVSRPKEDDPVPIQGVQGEVLSEDECGPIPAHYGSRLDLIESQMEDS